MPASSTIHSTHRWGAGSSLPKALVINAPPPRPAPPRQPSQNKPAQTSEKQSMLDVAQASAALMRRRSFYDVETTIKLASTINGPQQKCCWKEMSRSDLQIISLNCKVVVILHTFTDNKKAMSLPPTPIPGSNFFFFIINFLEWKISNKYKSRENSISIIALKFSPCSLNSYQLMNNLVSSVPLPTPTLQIIWK